MIKKALEGKETLEDCGYIPLEFKPIVWKISLRSCRYVQVETVDVCLIAEYATDTYVNCALPRWSNREYLVGEKNLSVL